MIALVTEQGTACAESGLCVDHDSTATKAKVAAEVDNDAVAWVPNVSNPEITCMICGATDQ